MNKAGPIVAVGVLLSVVGCGPIGGTHQAASGAPARYLVTVTETLPSTPQPITVHWWGTLLRRSHQWQHFTEQIGTTAAMQIIPTSKATRATTALMAPVNVKATAANQSLAVPALLRQELAVLNGTQFALPRDPMPLIAVSLATPITVHAHASMQEHWTTHVSLGSTVVPATVQWQATVAKPDGILKQADWTLVVSTQAARVIPAQGKPYWIPSLTWTERGTLRPKA